MDVLKNRLVYLGISWILLILSLFFLFIPKLNLWIDMTWWTQAEYSFESDFDIEVLREELSSLAWEISFEDKEVINDITAYTVSWENTLVVISGFDSSIEDIQLDKLKNDFREDVLNFLQEKDSEILETSYTNIGKSFWDYIKNTAIFTLILAIIAIAIYVYFAFNWMITWISILSFALITIITLFHDVIISAGAYILTSMYLPEFKIDTFFVTALLTILWYSINDTIVVFDRIRLNLIEFWGKKWDKWKNLYDIINLSINETIKRSIYTSLTLLFVLLTIFFFWPETIKWFILVMLFGTVVGTYSSIFIASPILYIVNQNKKLEIYKKKEVKIEDKIVV